MCFVKVICAFCVCVSFCFSEAMELQRQLEEDGVCKGAAQLVKPVDTPRARVDGLIHRILDDSFMLSRKSNYTKRERALVNDLGWSMIDSMSLQGKLFGTSMEFSRACENSDFKNMQGAGRAGGIFSVSSFIDDKSPLCFISFLAGNIDYDRVQLSTLSSSMRELPVVFDSAMERVLSSDTSKQGHLSDVTKKELIIVSYPFITPVRAGVKKLGSRRCSLYGAEEVRFFVVRKDRGPRITMFPSQWSPKTGRYIKETMR